MNAWVELKYGVKGRGFTICRLDHPYLLKVFKRCALRRAEEFTNQSEAVDEVIYLCDELEMQRLQKLLERLIPDSENEGIFKEIDENGKVKQRNLRNL